MKKESVKKLQDNLDVLVEIHTNLINEGKFNEAYNVMKNIDVITRQLKDWGIPIITENEVSDSFLDWYDILKFFIETKQSQLIELEYSSIEAQNKHRGTGKTFNIAKLAAEYNLTIYEPSKTKQSIFYDRLKELGIDTKISFINSLRGHRGKIILIDETTNVDVDINNIDYINNVLIGFKRKFSD